MAFSPDNCRLALGGHYGVVKLLDINTRTPTRPHGNQEFILSFGIRNLAFSPDGTHLLATTSTGSVFVLNVAAGQELCQLISFNDGTWAVVDKEGRFDASSAGDVEGLHWVVGNEPIALSQLRELYYEPNLLAKLMGHNKEPMRTVPAFKDIGLPPNVDVVPPVVGSTIATVKVTPGTGRIGKVKVSVNGSEFIEDARRPGLSPRAPRATLTVNLKHAPTLKPGADNVISVEAYTDTEPRLPSRPATATWKASGPAFQGKPRLYAIVAGVSDYAGNDMDLKYAGKDAVNVYTTLKMAAGNLFEEENVDIRLLTTSSHPDALDPSKETFEKAFADFLSSRPEDTVLVYLAGHGVTFLDKDAQDTYCYLLREAESKADDLLDEAVRRRTSVTDNELKEWLKKVPALKRVIILDTCGAGSVGDALTEKRSVPSGQIRMLVDMEKRVGTHTLMGCAADAVSYEATRYGQGLLTYALLCGIRGEALEGTFVDVKTLFGHVEKEVPKLAWSVGGIQKPIFHPSGETFSVGLMRPGDKAKVPIGKERPLVLRPNFQNEVTPKDNLNLGTRVRDRIKEIDMASARGEGLDIGIAYVAADDLPKALLPTGRYKVDGTDISMQLYVWKDELKVLETEMTGTTETLDDLVSRIVQAIAGAWKPENPETAES